MLCYLSALCPVSNVQFVFVITAEQSTAAVSLEEEGVYSGMLIRKHQWESTTKKASNRLEKCLLFYDGSFLSSDGIALLT